MKKGMIALIAALLIALSACAQAQPGYVDGKNADRVHLRAEANQSSQSLGLYFTGAPLENLYDAGAGWRCVQLGTERGYIRSEYVRTQQPAADGKAAKVTNGRGGFVNLRAVPSTQGAILAQVNVSTEVTVYGETVKGWCYIRANGISGYMDSDFLTDPVDKSALPVSPSAPGGALARVGYAANGDNIFRYTAENGAQIHFTSVEEEPVIRYEDVNFDGQMDLVAVITRGASNTMCEFFVWNGHGYTQVWHPGIDYGFANYKLYADKKLVVSHAVNGYAGAMFETCIYRWEGNELRLVRRAVSDLAEDVQIVGSKMIHTQDQELLRVQVRNYPQGVGEGSVIWQRDLPMDDALYTVLEGEMNQALWQGIW